MTRKLMLLPSLSAIVILALVLAIMLTTRGGSSGDVILGDIGSTSTTSLIYSCGQEMGIFASHGLNVTRVASSDAYTNLLNLLTGKIDVTFPSPSLIANAYNEGEKIRVAMALVEAKDLGVYAREGIDGIEELKGRKIGVIGRASDAYHILRWYMQAVGMDLEKDCQVVEIANPASLLLAFLTEKVDAATLWAGYAAEALENGGRILIAYTDALKATIGHAHYFGLAAITEDSTDGKTMDTFLRAVREVVQAIKAEPDEAARIWAEFSDQPVEKMMKTVASMGLTAEMNDEVIIDIDAFFHKAAQEGIIESAPPEDLYYTEWT